MAHILKATFGLAIILMLCGNGYGQDEGDDDPRGNVHLGTTIGAPLNPTARFVNIGWGLVSGAGYNFTRSHAVVGEFMWTKLFPSDFALDPIRLAMQNPNISASSNLYAMTGNYRYELRGRTLGTYLIAGGGWYDRTARLSQKITTGNAVACTPTWLWFGFSCTSGTVTAGQTIGSSASHTIGVNAGIGFTARVSEAPYRAYVESRYHYAPTKNISTQLITISVGIRY